MTTIEYLNLSSTLELSTAIREIDLFSHAYGGNGNHYLITLQAGASLTEVVDISAINLAGSDTLTINGQGVGLDGAGAYRGLFAYSGATTIENLTIENAVAQGGAGAAGGGAGGGGMGAGGGLFVASGANVTLKNVGFTGDSARGGSGGGRGGGGGGGLGGAGGSGPSTGGGGVFGGFGGGGGGAGVGMGGGGGFGGGGGATSAFGGAIFVMAGPSPTIVGGSLGAGTVAGGAGSGGGAGQAFGGGLFLQGTEVITLAPAKGAIETISGVIADQTGSGGTGADAGAGSLTLNGAGTLDLTAANTFTGGVTIDKGVLELAKARAGGTGGIHFASTSGEIEYSAGANLANAISGFGASDKIDFSTIAYANGDHAVDKAGAVKVETSAGSTVATFKATGTYASANFHVGADLSGHVLVTYVAAAASGAVIGSPADILGAYGPEFAEPPRARESMSAFDSWAALAAGAATDPRGFGSHYENNGTAGSARDAWGVDGNGSTGHGPGSAS